MLKNLWVGTGIDIMAVQDGNGASFVTNEELKAYLPEMDKALKSAGKEFWVDMEVFKYNEDKTVFLPTDIEKLVQVVEIEKNYPIVIWVYHPFMAPEVNAQSAKLFNDYFNYYSDNLLVGDGNGDKKVDLADFTIWKAEYLGNVSTKKSDFNKDDKVDLTDFTIWKKAYLYGSGTTVADTSAADFSDVPLN